MLENVDQHWPNAGLNWSNFVQGWSISAASPTTCRALIRAVGNPPQVCLTVFGHASGFQYLTARGIAILVVRSGCVAGGPIARSTNVARPSGRNLHGRCAATRMRGADTQGQRASWPTGSAEEIAYRPRVPCARARARLAPMRTAMRAMRRNARLAEVRAVGAPRRRKPCSHLSFPSLVHSKRAMAITRCIGGSSATSKRQSLCSKAPGGYRPGHWQTTLRQH